MTRGPSDATRTARRDPAIARVARRSLGVLALCVCALACQRTPANTMPVRLRDQIPAEERTYFEIAGMSRPSLPPLERERRIHVSEAPTAPVLTFTIGRRASTTPGVERFEVLLQPAKGEIQTVYTRDVDRAGWLQGSVDLSDRDLDGAELIFRRTPVSDFHGEPPVSAWTDPMLLPGTPARKPSVILVSIDTLRADKVGAYGNPNARTPVLDRMAAEGARFERAYAPSTWTVPSHASFLYGAYLPDTPAVLRARGVWPETRPLPERPIASLLARAGWVTAGFTGGGFLAYPWDFLLGFDAYYAYPPPPGEAQRCNPNRFDGAEVFRHAEAWLRKNHTAPFFLFLHTYDVHDRCPFTGFTWGRAGPWAKMDTRKQPALLEYYDRLIGETDRKIGDLLTTLDELGLREDTLVIVTSDHGEAFTEHAQKGHGCDMKPYEELARVPLLARWPKRIPAGESVAAAVSLIDIPSTILALVGLPPEPTLQGGVLPGLGLPATPGPSQPVYNHCGSTLAIWRGEHKLLTSHTGSFADELYDLSADPTETKPLPESDPSYAALRQDADAYWKTALATPNLPEVQVEQRSPDAATRERLRSLGYLK